MWGSRLEYCATCLGESAKALYPNQMYSNIPHSDGIEATREALEGEMSDKYHVEFLVQLLTVILKNNIFEFDDHLYKQNVGTGMGLKPSPSYANIFMDKKIDVNIERIIKNFDESKFIMKFFKRFLYDTSLLIKNSELSELTSVLDTHLVNSDTNSVVDTRLVIKNSEIIVDLYKKPTDRNLYLLPSSCHSPHVVHNIPFSLAFRIVRI